MRVGLIVDHPKRDLPGAVMLAYQLAKRGASSAIIPMYEQGVDVPRLGLDAIVMNYAREANASLIERYARAGLAVFVLDTEGGVLAETGGNAPPALARRMAESGIAKHLAGYFFWGPRLARAFADEGVLPPEALHVTGCPRFDFAAPKWRSLLDHERRGYVLVNANFPLVNPRFSGAPERERAAMIKSGWEAAYVDRLMADLMTVFERYLEEIKQLALARPERPVLVRPHPFESEHVYQAALAGLPNVTIDGRGSVLDVIRNAAAIVHLNCGTAIEGVLLGKLPLHLGYLDTVATANHAKLPAKISRHVESRAHLFTLLDNLERETEAFDFNGLHATYIHEFFYDNDGAAGDRVADVLVRHGGAARGKTSLSVGDVLSGCRPSPSASQRLKGSTSLVFGSAIASRLRGMLAPQIRDKVLDFETVKALVGQIAAIEAGDAADPMVTREHCRYLSLPLASLSMRAAI